MAYFKRDSKAARGVEKILKRIGVPGGRRAGGQNTVKRSVLCWTLAWIGDPKTSAFMKDEQIAKLKNIKAFWVAGLRSFYLRIARKCEGTGSIADIEGYIRGVVAYVNNERLGRYGAEGRSLMDEYRKDRNAEDFRPKGDYLLGGGRDT